MAWPTVQLRDVAKQVRRREVPQPGTAYRQIGVRLWGRGAYQRDTIDGSETKYSALYEVHTGDIIVNKIWARNGSISVITEDLDGSFGSSEFPTFVIDSSQLLPDWFYWYSKTRDLWSQCEKLSRGTSGQNRLRPERFLEVQLPLPPLSEQQRMVGRLDRLQSLVEKRHRAISAIEAETQAMLYKAFERVTAGAASRPISKVAPLVRRPVTEIDPDASYPELGVRSFGRGTFHKPALLGIKVGSKRLFRIEAGDLVFNNVFAWEGAVAIAQPEDGGRVGSHRFITCVPISDIATADFLRFYFLTRQGLQKLGEASPGGAGRNRTLGLKKLAAIRVPVPSPEAQQWFNGLQEKVRQTRKIRAATSIDIDALMSATLHEAFVIE